VIFNNIIAQTQSNKDLLGVIYDETYFSQITSDWRNNYLNKPNDFNWTNQSTYIRTFSTFDNPVTINGTNLYGSDDIELPFFRTSNPNVNNPNLLQYAINPFVLQNLDIHPEDGWEVLHIDFGGRIVSMNKLARANEINDYPDLILYNRYNSKIRIYILVPHNEAFNGAFISATFPVNPISQPDFNLSKRTALFSFAQPVSNTLIDFDNKCYLTSTSEYSPNARILQWIYGEFDVAYDPCTCLLKQNGFTSKILFQLYTTALSKIDLQGEGTTVTNIVNPNLIGAKNTGTANTSFMDRITGAYGSGLQYYNNWLGYSKDAKDLLTSGYNLWSKKLEKDFFKYYSGGINDPKTGLPITDLAGLKTSGIWGEWFNIDKTNDPTLNFLKTAENIASFVPYVGAAVGVVDYLVNGGKKSAQTVAAPSVSKTRFQFQGNLAYTVPRNITLNTPGAMDQSFMTINSNNDDNERLKHGNFLSSTDIPAYNHTLGVFNIIEEPEFESINYTKNIHSVDINSVGVGSYKPSDQTYNPINWFDVKECRMTKIPKYVVNPAADVEVVSIDAAIVLEFASNPDGYNLFMSKYSDWSKFYSLPYHKDYWKDANSLNLEDRIKSIEDSGLELDYVSDIYPNINSIIRFRTAYVPYNCLMNPTFTVFEFNKGMKVYIKLIVRLKRKHKGSSYNFVNFTDENENIPINMVLTYDVTNSYTNKTNNTWATKGNLNIEQTPFHIAQQDGSVISPEDYANNRPFATLGDWRCYKINILSTSYKNPFIPGGNLTYSTGQTNIYTMGDLVIPSGVFMPSNTKIKVGGSIYLNENISFGNNIEIIAGKEIIVDKSITILNPNITLKIEPIKPWMFNNCENSDINSLRANDNEIMNVCLSTKYKNSAGLTKTNTKNDEVQKLPDIKSTFIVNVYPNPSADFTQLFYNLEKNSTVTISVFDISGNQILNVIDNKVQEPGEHIEYINIQSLSAGIYFIRLNTAEGYGVTKKLLIAK
jgi:hypothetical protein